MINEVFSDYFVREKNFLTKIDTRIKIIFVFLAIIITISSRNYLTPVIVVLLVVVSLLCIKIPIRIIMIRLAGPSGIALTILFIQTFFYGTTTLFKFNLFGFYLIAYLEGATQGLLIMSKIIGATSLVLFLSMTTLVSRILSAGYWFKVPKTWIEVSLFAYRYIFVLLEDAITVFEAQKIRLGYSNLTKSLRSLGTLAGAIVIRAYDQSISTYEAMLMRGYDGNLKNISHKEKFEIKDIITSFIFFVILLILFIL